MQPNNKDWLVALSGVGFIVLAIIAFTMSGSPKDAGHKPSEIVQFWVDHKSDQQVAAFVILAAAVLLVVFGAYLFRFLRSRADEGDLLSLISFVGVAIVAIGIALDTTISLALIDRADDLDPKVVQGIQAIFDDDFVPLALGVVLFLLGTGFAVIRTGALPRWIGWAMVAFAVISFTPIGFAGAIGAALMVIVLSVMLSLRARTPSTAVTG
jgi:Domain of unknown function (DUF4386)